MNLKADPPRVGPSAEPGNSKPTRLGRGLENLAVGLRAGVGITSQRSVSMIGGEIPDLVPVVVCLSREDGFTTFLTALATLCALKEERSGDVILMQSFNLDVGALTSLLETSRASGNAAVIRFEISMKSPGPDGTFAST